MAADPVPRAADGGGNDRPAEMDMIRERRPHLGLTLQALDAEAKMVGNMIDMKKLVSHSAPTATPPFAIDCEQADVHR